MNHVRFLGERVAPGIRKASINGKIEGSEEVMEPKVLREKNKIEGKSSWE